MTPIHTRILKYCFALLSLTSITSCDTRIGDTVESSFISPYLPDLSYKFSRNGTGSVYTYECSSVLRSKELLMYRLMRPIGYFKTREDIHEQIGLFHTGIQNDGISPYLHVCSSPRHAAFKSEYTKTIEHYLQEMGRISGAYSTSPISPSILYQLATPGHWGRITIGKNDRADEKGLMPQPLIDESLLGAINLDKIINLHLSQSLFTDPELQKNQDQGTLLHGRNFTELESHWDLAYGYYATGLSGIAQAEEIKELRGIHRRLNDAFVLGRIALGISSYDIPREALRYGWKPTDEKYDLVLQYLNDIKKSLSVIVSARIADLLSGPITTANLREDPKQAFIRLSRAYGLMDALPFLEDQKGEPYFTHEEIRAWRDELMVGNGFWDTERLLAPKGTKGSLCEISDLIRKRIENN